MLNIIRKIQIKTTKRYHSLDRMIKTKTKPTLSLSTSPGKTKIQPSPTKPKKPSQQNSNQALVNMLSNQNSLTLLLKCKMVQSVCKTVSYTINRMLTIWPSNLNPESLLKRNRNLCSHRNLHVNVYSTLFIVIKIWK